MNFKLIVGLIVPLSLLLSCGGKNTVSSTSKIKSLPTYKLVKKDTIVSNKFVADIQAKKNIEIHARISGLMEKVLVNEGQSVRKGQLLFKLNDAELQIELLKSQATLKNAQADLRMAAVELRQMQTLFDKKVIADNELEMAKAKHEAAEAKVAYANAEKNAIVQQISFTSVHAPFDGVIDRIPLKEGSLIQNGSLLTTVSELDEIYAYFSLPENYYFQLLADNRLDTHRDIQLILPNGTKYDYEGHLETAEGEIDRQTGSIQFKAKFNNPNGMIKHGTSGKLIISEFKPKALLVPLKSVFSIQDKRYVFTLQKDGKVKMQPIVISGTLEGSYIVESGVKEGQIIVREGTQSLRDGERIKAKKSIQ
jgi:membrane fusion protein, multidrug efflux system